MNILLKRFTFIFSFLLLFFLFSKDTYAATYYVAKTGDNGNPGTEADPFLTVNKGVSVLTPGDTLYVKAGTYAESLEDVIPSGTSWDNPVTVAAYPGDTPTLLPVSVVDGSRVLFFDGSSGTDSYIIIDGFVLDASSVTSDAIKITNGSNHIRIQNSEIENSNNQGVLIVASSGYNEFLNDTIHDNGDATGEHGMYIGSDHNTVRDSTIYSNFSDGIKLNDGIDNSYSTQNNIYRNKSYSNGESGIEATLASNNLIYNNIVHDNQFGIRLRAGGQSQKIYNNTIYHDTNGGIYFDSDYSDTIVSNNIVSKEITIGISIGATVSNTTLQNNLVSNNATNYSDSGTGTTLSNNLIGDTYLTRFVNAQQNNFQLVSTSDAIDNGITLSEVTSDYAQISRPQGSAYDIGAYEYAQSSTTTSTPTPNPASPSTTVGGAYSPSVKLVADATGSTGISSSEGAGASFEGTTSPHATIEIHIKTENGKSIPGIVTADGDGNWSWTPPSFLSPGQYSATFTAQDGEGNRGTTSLEFTIDESGESKVTQVTQETNSPVNQNVFQKIINFIRKLFSIS